MNKIIILMALAFSLYAEGCHIAIVCDEDNVCKTIVICD